MSIETLHIVTAFPRSEDEVTITPWMIETLRCLKDRGIGVTVLSPSYKGLDDQILWGIPVKRFRYFPKRWEDLTHDVTTPVRLRQNPLYIAQAVSLVLCSIPAAKKVAREIEPDIIHVHWPFPLGIPGLKAAEVANAKLILKFYSAELVFLRKRAKFLTRLLKKPVERADLVLSISSYAGELFNSLFPDKKVHVMPAVYAASEPSEIPEFVKKADPLEILFVGRFVERKGLDVLISAFDRVRKQLDARLVIVGGGPLETELRKQVSMLGLDDIVEFAIKIPQDELDRRYNRASVFVLPAIYDRYGDTEGLGMVLIEALSKGTPVIGSRAGGIIDIVRDGETGLAVEPGDPEDLAEAIIKLLTNKELAEQLARKGADYVKEHFSRDGVTDRLVGFYRELMGSQDQ